MKVRVKFFCECDAYVEDILDPDFEPIENTDKTAFQLSFRHAVCENCYKSHEIMIIHFPDDRIIASASDVEEFSYERL